ncbi:MAG: alcohol dehydrogenase catalytic domain-containing protein [Bryobacterales bacterium]|nr:alcohol dehydrogenase catalytic domain-containing protein [Bryobacterales bacterium]
MRKVVWLGRDRLEYLDDGAAPPPALAPHEVLVAVSAAGVCSTDVHIIEGKIQLAPPPLVLGHEFAGRVTACGSGVRSVKLDDRVKCDSVVGCGCCAWCSAGSAQFCAGGSEFGITRDGAWAEWIVVPERNLHRLPGSISDAAAAILDPEVYGPLRKAGIAAGDTVAVFGPGPAGLVATQIARILGAGRVLLCGTRAERLALGRRLGADHAINVAEDDPVEAIRELTGGRGADLVFEAAGTEASVLQALAVLRPQGKAVFYGVHGRNLHQFPIDSVVLRDLVVYGALTDRVGWDDVIGWAASGRLDLNSIITHRFPLDRAAAAYETIRDRRQGAVKAVLEIAKTGS